MPGQLSSSLASRKDSIIAAWNECQGQSSKLGSWLCHVFARAPPFPSQPLFQEISHLLSRLPLEVRHQIYAEVMTSFGTVQHVELSNKKLAHVRCAFPETHLYFQTTWKGRGHSCQIYENCILQSAWDGWGIISLLLSCRQIYSEFIEIVYSSTTFRMPIRAAKRFIDIVSAPLLALTHVNLQFTAWGGIYGRPRLVAAEDKSKRKLRKAREVEWETFWRSFARVQVRCTVVEIYDSDSWLSEQALLEPLRQVSAKGMEVLLPWPKESDTSGDFEDAEFAVRRPPEGMDLTERFDVAKGGPWPFERSVWVRVKHRHS